MSLEDRDGRLLSNIDKPKLIAAGIFEGPVDFTFYQDAVEGSGKCMHCHGIVKQLLYLPVSDQILPNLSGAQQEIRRESAKQSFLDMIQRNHQCPVLFDGKDTAEDFMKRFQ